MTQYQQPPNPWNQQQSQPLPPQYPPSPQSYQQPPPPRTRAPMRAFMGWFALGILVGIGIGYAAHVPPASSSPNTPVIQATTQDTSVASQPTAAPTSATNSVGTAVTSGIWQITINTVKTSTGADFETPKAGNIYLVINFTVKNTDSANHDMNPLDFTLRDAQGTPYNWTLLEGDANPDGTVVAGQQLRADLSYEVPKSLHSFVLQFDPPGDIDDSQVVQWNISVK